MGAPPAVDVLEAMALVTSWSMGQCFSKQLRERVPESLWDSQDFAESVVSSNPWALNFCSERLRDRRDLVELATKREARCICLATQRVKNVLQCEGRYIGGWGDY